MNISETGRVLAKAAAIDNRSTSDAAILAWHEILADLEYADCLDAVTRHRQGSPGVYLEPGHVRRLARTIREDRQRRENPHQARALPGRFETDQDRDKRLGTGLSQCRDVLATIRKRLDSQRDTTTDRPLSPSDEIRERALARKRADQEASRGKGRAA